MNECEVYVLLISDVKRMAYGYSKAPAIVRDNAIDIDDLIQEASIAFIQAVRSYNKSTSFRTWYDRVCHNYMRDLMRHNSRQSRSYSRESVHVGEEHADRLPAHDFIGDYEVRATIRKAVTATLPTTDAEILLMYLGVGGQEDPAMTQQEIAEEFGISQSSVGRVIERAMANKDLMSMLGVFKHE